jgi:hypothetical protein
LFWDENFSETIKSFIFLHNLEEEDPLRSNPQTFPDIVAAEGCYAGDGWSIVKHFSAPLSKIAVS